MPGTNAIHFSGGAVEDALIRPLGPPGTSGLYSNAVSFWNFAATNYTFTLSVCEFGLAGQFNDDGVEAWSNTNFVVSGSFTMPCAQTNTELVTVFLVPPENGAFTGNGSGLTNVPAGAIVGGLTANLAVLVPGGGTNTLCFTNGVLRAIQ